MTPPIAWTARLGAFVAIGTSPAALMLGGAAGRGTDGLELVAGLVAGIVGITLLVGAQGSLGPGRGELSEVLAGPLGRSGGARVASLAMLLMMLGWFGVNAGAGGAGLALLTGLPERPAIALYALALVALVARGVGLVSRAALLAGLATIALVALGLVLAADVDAPPADVPGADSWLQVATLVIGYAAAFALRAPDFTHELASRRHAWWAAAVGIGLPLAVLVPAGAVLEQAAGTWRLADAFEALGAPLVGGAFLALGFAGSAATNLYSGTRALGAVRPGLGPRAQLGAVAVAGGIAAIYGLSDALVPFLTALALAAPGLVVVCVVHAALGGPSRPWWAIGSWLLGVAVSVALDLAGYDLALISGVLVTALAYGGIASLATDNGWSRIRRRRAGGDTGG
jgi:purine-cytosine permease-like protein